MKVIATREMRFGLNQFAEGDEIDLPDNFARQLIHAGHATEADEKKPAENKKTYKTRQIKAEDTD